MAIKLIAIDMDGTLLLPDHTISPAVKAAIAAARERGVNVVLTTGRPYAGVHSYLKELHMEQPGDYCITYNGALVQKAGDGSTVAQIREAFGNEIEFGLDFHGRVSAPMAKVLIKELEPYRPLFIEEPVLAEQAEYYPRLAAQTHIPIAAGERMFSRFEFKRVLEAGGVAILQPDLSHAGGITECYKIAGMAEAYDVGLAPHCPLGPIALAACLHVDFVSHNAVFQEQSMGIHYNKGAELLDFVKNKEDFNMEGGFFKPLMKPGLGVEIDETRVIELSKNAPDWRNPLWRYEDGSVAEW